LRLALTESLIKNRKFDTLEIEKQTNLVTYISRFKKGSKRFRIFFEDDRNEKITCKQKPTVKNFFDLTH
jgi:catabolite regulation protein CreA